MTISCEQCREWLSDLLDDEDQGSTGAQFFAPVVTAPSPGAHGANGDPALPRALVLAHLATCVDCACDLNILRHARAELRLLPQQAAPTDLRARVRAALAATPVTVPLLTPATSGAETLHQVPASNGHHRPAPRYAATQPGFMTSLLRFFSRPANVAWATGATFAAFGLMLFTNHHSHLVMPTAAPTTIPSDATALAPESGKSVKPSVAAAPASHAKAPDKKLARAAVSSSPPSTTNDTAPVADAAPLIMPPVSTDEASSRPNFRHRLAAQHSNDERTEDSHAATTPVTVHSHSLTHQSVTTATTATNLASGHTPGTGGLAATPTPKGDGGAQVNTVATPATPPASDGSNTSGLYAQAPFASLSITDHAATGDTNNQATSPQSLNPVETSPAGPPGSALTAPTSSQATAPTGGTPGAANDSAPVGTGNSRIAVAPNIGIHRAAPLHPRTLIVIKPTPNEPVTNFGLVGAARGAHLVVVPTRDIKTARLDIALSSGLRYADQTSGTWRTVWHGAAQQGHPIKLDLNLVATAPGTQKIKVMLMEVSDAAATDNTADATLAQGETLNVNVTAP